MQESMTPKRHPLKIIKDVFFYGIIGFLTFIIVISVSMDNGLINTLGFGWYRVKSGSMEDLIMVNDFIVATKTDISTLEKGDIIIFETWVRPEGSISYIYTVVTHHFYEIDEEGHVITYPHTRNDFSESNSAKYDKWNKPTGEVHFVTPDDIVGKHAFTIPTAGLIAFLNYMFASPIGWSLLIVNVGLIVLIIWYVKTNFKKPNPIESSEDTLKGDDPDDKNLG